MWIIIMYIASYHCSYDSRRICYKWYSYMVLIWKPLHIRIMCGEIVYVQSLREKLVLLCCKERVEILRLINFAQVHRRSLSLQRHCGRWSRILFFCRWKWKQICLGVKCLFWNGESVRINVERSFTWPRHIVLLSINKHLYSICTLMR